MSYKRVKNYLAGWGLILGAAIGGSLYFMTGQVLYFGGAGIGLIIGAIAQSYQDKQAVTV